MVDIGWKLLVDFCYVRVVGIGNYCVYCENVVYYYCVY